ncbi:MAG: energy-coupling factor transporter transmembrane protein EcfT [Lachnospiraceae bacterium]|nr:energy-coupling factor transporter transmembrane protein EcfT [Lachnospiraceae bacterium]
MRSFKDHNPAAVAFYFLAVTAVSMFTMNPVLHILTFIGGITQFSIQKVGRKTATHLFFIGLGIVLALIRPVFNHNGATVLFVVNDNPITKEAFIYGVNAAIIVVGVLYLFRVFSIIMTSDRLLYLFGRFSPKTALVMSMGLRYVPLLREKSRQIKAAQTAIGINRDDNAIDRIKAGLNVFSATISWGLENGIITADSMAARGYGKHKRTQFSRFSFTKSDMIIILLTIGLIIPSIMSFFFGYYNVAFYPYFEMKETNGYGVVGYITFAILMMMPVAADITENFRWKRLMSRI